MTMIRRSTLRLILRRRQLMVSAALLFFLALVTTAGASPFWLDLETGAAFTGYNDVRIPADDGTAFSLADNLSPQPVWYYRLLEGGSDGGGSVYTFSMFHYASAGVRYRF